MAGSVSRYSCGTTTSLYAERPCSGWAKAVVRFDSQRARCQERTTWERSTSDDGRPSWAPAHQEFQSNNTATSA